MNDTLISLLLSQYYPKTAEIVAKVLDNKPISSNEAFELGIQYQKAWDNLISEELNNLNLKVDKWVEKSNNLSEKKYALLMFRNKI
jgi:hypothetical protein